MKRNIAIVNKVDNDLNKFIHTVDFKKNVTETRAINNNIVLIIDSNNTISDKWIKMLYYYIELQYRHGAPIKELNELIREMINNVLCNTV